MRKPFVAGNWKMNKTLDEATALVGELVRELGNQNAVDVALCPPFTALATVGKLVEQTTIAVGGQNMHPAANGAFTGEISAGMLRDLYCRYVILGHSERRALFGESDAFINEKVKAALAANLRPILCVGETLEEREQGVTETVVATQLVGGLVDVTTEQMAQVTIAYEPVWAIGTGKTASPAQAQDVHAFIRGKLTERFDANVAGAVRIQYGGSVKPDNAAELFGQPDIDGGLIGGASLDAPSFTAVVNAAG